MAKHLLFKSNIMEAIFQNVKEYILFNSISNKVVRSIILMMIVVNGSVSHAQDFIGDTTVCPGSTVHYEFTGGPWTVTLLGGGTLNPVPGGPVDTFNVTWGNQGGTFLIRFDNGMSTYYQTIIVEGDLALACDDLVNVSLNGDCEALITPGVMLEGTFYPDDSYQVTVFNTNGIPLPGNVVTYAQLGKVLTVNVSHLCSGVSCWGRIYIEDKFIPELMCRDTAIVVECTDDYSPNAVGFPLPVSASVSPSPTNSQCFIVKNFDLCCDVELCYYDVYVKNGCNSSTGYYAQIQRNWSATDCKGNKTSCIDSIYILQGDISLVECPPNYDGFQLPALECDSIEPSVGPYPAGWNALDNGNPSPYDYVDANGNVIWKGTGVPSNIGCEHIAVTYRDVKIPVCGNSFKLLRNWRVFDWCTGRLFECVQFIKVTDQRPPVVSCSQNYISFPTDYYRCSGTAIIPPPSLVIDCSETSFTVEYKLAGPDGKPEDGDYRTDNITYVNGNAEIADLPIDTTWVTYIVSDACGNTTRCRIEVLIVDELDPVAVCDEHTVISINEQGVGKLYATSVNSGSFDNCTLDSMAIRRMTDWCGIPGNTDFGPSVTFCCEDLTRNPHMVVFRVWDKQGNFNDCMVSVTVQEKIPPTITCPPPATVDCGTNLDDLNILGRAVATNTCNNTIVTYVDIPINFKCGTGTIRRRWTATTAGGQIAVCDQSITVVDQNPITANSITWPSDITVNGCKASDAHPDFAGKPILPVTPCSNLISGYTDERFYNVGGYCIKIIRHWRVIDWCLYDVNNPNSAGIYSRDQLIFVRNTTAPTIDNATCAPKEVCANDATCNATVELIGTATDDCTDNSKLIWSYRIDYNNDGSFNISNPGNNASGLFPGGTHRIEWTVMDSCGNSSSCTQTLRVKDCKAPTPFCKAGLITVPMPSTKSVTIPARFYNEKSDDNCTAQPQLRYSYSTNVNDTLRTYTCADIDNGRQDTLNVRMYVTDLDGNQNFCDTKLFLQDNGGNPGGFCNDKFTNGGIISGLVNAGNGSVLQNAHLELLKTDVMFGQINSERTGEYVFVDLPEGEDYKLQPKKNDDIANGVSTADIVLIQKHILGLQKFNSPFQYIAADVNNTHTVTASDISDIRKLILGITDSFKNGTESWTFVVKDQTFPNPENPWEQGSLTNLYEVKSLKGDMNAMDFTGIKMGDVNYTAKTTELNNGSQSRSSEKMILEVDNLSSVKSGQIEIPVYGSWRSPLAGFQMTLEFNAAKANFVAIKSGVLSIGDDNLGMSRLDNGLISMSWNDRVSIAATDKPLFYLVLNVTKAVNTEDLIKINHSVLNVEAYTDQLEIMDIELRIKGNANPISSCELFQNQPNPFGETTVIGFHVSAEQTVNIQIFDLKGVEVYHKEVKASKGNNQIVVSKSDIGESGIYYYQMQAGNFVGIKKLMINN